MNKRKLRRDFWILHEPDRFSWHYETVRYDAYSGRERERRQFSDITEARAYIKARKLR